MEFHEAINSLEDLSLEHPELYEELQDIHLAIMKNIFDDSEAYKRMMQLIGEISPDPAVSEIKAVLNKRVNSLHFCLDLMAKKPRPIKPVVHTSKPECKIHRLNFGGMQNA